VREGQAAVFVHEGRIADVFPPGLYMLETNNMPIMTRLQHWDHGFRSPFKSEVYFVNTTRFRDLKWGTRNPVMLRDPEFGPTRIRAFGTYTVKVGDPGRFLSEVVGTDGNFTTDEISDQIRNIIVQEFSRVIAGSGIPVLDMAANTQDLGRLVAKAISDTMAGYGLSVPELYIENISLPPSVDEALDKRTSMGLAGDLDKFEQPDESDAMSKAARSGAGGAAANPTPPPPPVEHVWHIAEAGQIHGPYSRAALGRMAQQGALTRETYVWTAGQDGWQRAEDVTELAQLFTVLPPPPPEA
jgi:membrane protease subunit (stomatin/prohibitin family)